MKRKTALLAVVLAVACLFGCGRKEDAAPDLMAPRERLGLKAEVSPDWVRALPEAGDAEQLFVVAAHEKTTAWVSMHEKDENGAWRMILSTPGFIGKNGLGKTREGDGMTPAGAFRFNRAFGIAPDPGCTIPYVQVDENAYWSGDTSPGMHYNELVSIRDLPALDTERSEHLVDFPYEYQYCLSISYNADGTPNAGSAIFLHCFGDRMPCTGGCVAIPMDQMHFVLRHVSPDCVVVIGALDHFLPAAYKTAAPKGN